MNLFIDSTVRINVYPSLKELPGQAAITWIFPVDNGYLVKTRNQQVYYYRTETLPAMVRKPLLNLFSYLYSFRTRALLLLKASPD